MASKNESKDYIPEGFKKVGNVMRLTYHEKIKAIAEASGTRYFRVMDKLLQNALEGVEVPKKVNLDSVLKPKPKKN